MLHGSRLTDMTEANDAPAINLEDVLRRLDTAKGALITALETRV